MVDKFINKDGKVVLKINDNNIQEIDPSSFLKKEKEECIICNDCKHGVLSEFLDGSSGECEQCGSTNTKKFRRVSEEILEIKEDTNGKK